jgi:hypothetical protein
VVAMQFWIINNKQEWLKSQLLPFEKVIITSNILRGVAIYLFYVLIEAHELVIGVLLFK